MPSSTPTFADQKWGSEPWCRFDYWRHPTRENVTAEHPNGTNPLLCIRHGGGGTGGDYTMYRTDAIANIWFFFRWLQETGSLARKFDICSFSSGQAAFYSSPQVIPKSVSMYFPDSPVDAQRFVATIKHRAVEFGFDPNSMLGMGESFGAVDMSLAMMAPPIVGNGNSRTWLREYRHPQTFDSQLRGVIYHIGQVDCRKTGGVDYIHSYNMAGWFGTRTDSTSETDALPTQVREMASLLSYLERGDTANYRGLFVMWGERGDHVKPYGNPSLPGSDVHDSQQFYDLCAALDNRGLPYGKLFYAGNGLTNINYPSAPPHTQTVYYQTIYNWMVGQLAA